MEDMERMDLQLDDIQETALIPLAIRANETKRENARIHDEKDVEIIETLKMETKDLDKFFSHEGVVARTILFDRTVKKLPVKYPDVGWMTAFRGWITEDSNGSM